MPIQIQKLFARDSSSPKNAVMYYEAADDQANSFPMPWNGFPIDTADRPRVYFFALTKLGSRGPYLFARDSSSPKNAAIMFETGEEATYVPTYEAVEESNGMEDGQHSWADQNGNGRSDQRRRGGL